VATPLRRAALEIAFPSENAQVSAVTKLCIFVGTTVVGYGAGFLVIEFGIMTQVIVSGIGSIVGVYLGWRVGQRIEKGHWT
jgi:uncharacterized membrane protein YfcA